MKSGIILVKKPLNFTSRDVVNKLVRKFHNRKIGHSGTLDPFADGLLLIVCEKATKLIPFMDGDKKTYVATLKLGFSTTTGDKTGEKLNEKDVPSLKKEEIESVFKKFIGKQKQIPPMFSAVLHNGVRLYDIARKGKEVEREPRDIEIFDLKLISFDNDVIKFETTVSKGTYIRVLGEDIAVSLGTFGNLTELTRTKIGEYSLENAKEIDEVDENDIIEMSEMKFSIPTFYAYGTFEPFVRNGSKIKFNKSNEDLILFRNDKELIAVYEKVEDGVYACKRGLL